MTMPSGAGQPDTTLTRDLLYAARYYLGRSRTWMILAAAAIATGLVFNWNWLVAAGLAPVLLSILPCLFMCAFGVCMMCRSAKEQSPSVRTAAQAPLPPAAAIDRLATEAIAGDSVPGITQSIAAASPEAVSAGEPTESLPRCCHGSDKATSAQTINPQPTQERKVPNA